MLGAPSIFHFKRGRTLRNGDSVEGLRVRVPRGHTFRHKAPITVWSSCLTSLLSHSNVLAVSQSSAQMTPPPGSLPARRAGVLCPS